MRGRQPEVLTIPPADARELERIAHSETSPWYQVRRARIVLEIAAGQRRENLASQVECDESTIWRTCQRYRRGGLVELLADHRNHSGRDLVITPVQRAQIVELACLEPVAKGLHITHWSSEDLARQAVTDGIVAQISPRTVRKILSDVDLQPHRTRYWKTARLDAQFKERAEQVLWCYGNAARLAKQGIWVVCVDEIPTFQILERHPIRRAVPGSIEQREHDYTRHGTSNLLVFLVVHTGLLGEERQRALRSGIGTLPPTPPGVAGGFLDPGRRAEPHRRCDPEVLWPKSRVVATALYTGQRLVAQPS
jgi:transposase